MYEYKQKCRNGPSCSYLAEGRCRFYHPLSHIKPFSKKSNHSSNYTMDKFTYKTPTNPINLYFQTEKDKNFSFLTLIMRKFIVSSHWKKTIQIL